MLGTPSSIRLSPGETSSVWAATDVTQKSRAKNNRATFVSVKTWIDMRCGGNNVHSWRRSRCGFNPDLLTLFAPYLAQVTPRTPHTILEARRLLLPQQVGQ